MIGGRKADDEVWYVHAPLKNETRPLVHAPPPSNIPYLNGVMDTEEDLAKQRPELTFKETDSDFVRLAKMGGRHDLLVHKQPSKAAPKEPVGYPIPAWWLDMYVTDQEKNTQKSNEPYKFQVPAWFVHKDKIDMSQLPPKVQTTQTNSISKYEEKIEEPRKYGQLRNYMHPIKITNQSNQRAKPIPQYSQMEKLNGPEKERPKDYQEWKNRQDKKIIN